MANDGDSLTWGFLQERLTTTPYGPVASPELFKYPVFLNTIQSCFAALTGYFYLSVTRPSSSTSTPPIFPRPQQLLPPLLLVALTSSLASPFGYASLSHIDYITFLLAKSCKLLPVMFLHITLFQKRYPLYKYLVVLSVTLGVAIFTLHASSGKTKSKASALNPDRNSSWGLLLLGINLLFDGLTNTTQDYIFTSLQPFTGPQMMCANNILSTILTLSYLGASPYLAQTPLGSYLGMDAGSASGELVEALGFLARHPSVWGDVLGFAACGAIGQIFICRLHQPWSYSSALLTCRAVYTLATFSSLLLVTITVTRKMLTMILSVVWFGHTLGGSQWLGVGLVFGGIGAEAIIQRREKAAKSKAKSERKKEL